jgi:CNT family concentrative nucleoside transporter
MAPALQSLVGFVLLGTIAWALSENRRAVPWRIVIPGVALQFLFAFALLRLPGAKGLFLGLNDALLALERATQAGTALVFGYLGGAPLPFAETQAGASFVLAFRALPLVLVVSALASLLFYWRVLPLVVNAFAALLVRILGIGGAVGVSTAANVFVGMVEAPVVIRPYLARLDRGELFMVMAGGMASTAGTVMVLYATILGPVVPDAMGHILVASIVSAPAALVVAALMVPPGPVPTAGGPVGDDGARSSMDAVTRGTIAGAELLVNIIAMIVVLVALVTLVNFGLGTLPAVDGGSLSLQRMLGWAMAPAVWLAGVPWAEAPVAGALMGTKTVLNELVAYIDLARLPGDALSARSRVIMTYAMCGFANFGSLGILIGGLGTMVPERRSDIVALGMKSIVAGTLATLMTGAVIGVVW